MRRIKWEGREALTPGRHVIEFDFKYNGLGMETLMFGRTLLGTGRIRILADQDNPTFQR